jgi:hypothetical protein
MTALFFPTHRRARHGDAVKKPRGFSMTINVTFSTNRGPIHLRLHDDKAPTSSTWPSAAITTACRSIV